MIDVERTAVPEWLAEIRVDSAFPVGDVLDGSLYYPACGSDGDPVKYLGGLVHSFIYVDYGVRNEELRNEIKIRAFLGYDVLFHRELSEPDLVPHDWKPMSPTARDGDPGRFVDRSIKPYALWLVFQRKGEFHEDHGPERFSLLYICGDGVATYQALYGGNKVSPRVLAIIQPGTGFGFNWMDFRKSDGFLAQSVRAFSPIEPPYMLYGGWARGYHPCCWPQYSEQIAQWRSWSGGEIGLWRMNRARPCQTCEGN